jgi:hypothetical protein
MIQTFLSLLVSLQVVSATPSLFERVGDFYRLDQKISQNQKSTAIVSLAPKNELAHQVIVFLSSTCPCSVSHESLLKSLAAEFKQKDFQFFGVLANQSEDRAGAERHFQSADLGFPILLDLQLRLLKELRALKTPHVFILNSKGETVYRGAVTDSHDAPASSKNYLKTALQQIAQGQAVDPRQTRPLGCLIDR